MPVVSCLSILIFHSQYRGQNARHVRINIVLCVSPHTISKFKRLFCLHIFKEFRGIFDHSFRLAQTPERTGGFHLKFPDTFCFCDGTCLQRNPVYITDYFCNISTMMQLQMVYKFEEVKTLINQQ